MQSTLDFTTRKHWVFDLDGTLTIPVHNFDAIRQQLGLPDKCDILATLAAMPEEQALPLRKELDQIEIELAKKSLPSSGAYELIALLHQKGIRLGILTRNSRQNAWISLKALGIDSFFEEACVLGRSEAAFKPNPDGLHRLAQHWEVPSEKLVMVGDYLYDLQAGRAAGTLSIHMDPSSQFLWPEWTDLAVSNLNELSALFSP